jgi:hypothetical protein
LRDLMRVLGKQYFRRASATTNILILSLRAASRIGSTGLRRCDHRLATTA